MTDPGRFSGKLSDVFLSDRWFSWEHPIDLNMEMQTSTALAETVKQLMVDEGSKKPFPQELVLPVEPSMPVQPKTYGFFTRARPREPNLPSEPLHLDEPESKSWAYHFLDGLIWDVGRSVLLIGGLVIFFPKSLSIAEYLPWLQEFFRKALTPDFFAFWGSTEAGKLELINLATLATPVLALAIGSSLFRAFSKNTLMREAFEKKAKKSEAKYNKSLESYHSQMEAFNIEKSKLEMQEREEQEDQRRFEVDQKKYDIEMLEHKAICKNLRDAYASEKAKVFGFRKALWKSARVCTRCGTAYLGEELTSS